MLGAHGLVVILAGIVAGLRDDSTRSRSSRTTSPRAPRGRTTSTAGSATAPTSSSPAPGLDARSFVPRLEEIGDSVLVVGDEATLKVHVHTDEPEVAVAVFEEVGRRAAARRRGHARADRSAGGAPATRPGRGRWCVAAGDGMRTLFEGLGAHVVDGGPTLNPSTYEILAGIHEVTCGGGPRAARTPRT